MIMPEYKEYSDIYLHLQRPPKKRKPLFSRVFGFPYIKNCEKALSLYEIKSYFKI